MIMILAVGLAGFAGLVGMSMDFGRAYVARGDLQSLADGAALAAGQNLPDQTAATATALAFVLEHGGAGTTAEVVFSTTNTPSDTLTVTVSRTVDYWFLKFVGHDGTPVESSATARTGTYVGGSGILPIALTVTGATHNSLTADACYEGEAGGIPQFEMNTVCSIHYGSGFGGATGSGTSGDFGALVLDSLGSTQYEQNLEWGSDAVYEVGDDVDVLTGNMGDETDTGIEERMDRGVPAGCPGHARAQVMQQNEDGTVSVRPGCEGSPRIAVIPVVDQIDPSGVTDATIIGFAFVFIHCLELMPGGHKAMAVEFVTFVTALKGGIYADGDGASAVLLVE
jgi:Flp pilus assembly protein TadG